MSTPYTRIPFFVSLIAIANLSIALFCMEDNLLSKLRLQSPEYPPLKRPINKNFSIEEYNENDFLNQYDNKSIIRTEKTGDRFDTCFTCAITEHLNITGQAPEKLKISCATDLITECNVLEKYYDQIGQPIHDCLVVYTEDNKVITHFGVVTTVTADNKFLNCKVKQKWGIIENIIETELFNIPMSYGNDAYFYKLKNCYRKDKTLFLQSLQTDIAQSKKIKRSLFYTEKLLLMIANGSDVIDTWNEELNDCETLIDKASYLLKTCMGLNINTQTRQTRQTPLMLAVKKNNIDLVDLFIDMGANINQTDAYGNTALLLATKSKHNDIIFRLLCHNADETIANKAGEKPLIKQNIRDEATLWQNILITIAYGEKINFLNEIVCSKTPYEQAVYILKDGIKVNINAQPDDDKRTPLIIATNNNNLAMVQLFIEHGADITLRDSYGLTALDYAHVKNNTVIAEYIKQKISDL